MKSCREVAWLVSSGELEHRRGWGRWSIAMHLSMCEHCSRLARQLQQIGRTTRHDADTDVPAGLEDRIVKNLSKRPRP